MLTNRKSDGLANGAAGPTMPSEGRDRCGHPRQAKPLPSRITVTLQFAGDEYARRLTTSARHGCHVEQLRPALTLAGRRAQRPRGLRVVRSSAMSGSAQHSVDQPAWLCIATCAENARSCRDEVRFELSADEILGEPDDQVVIDGHPHPFAERLLTPACAPAVGDIAAPSV
jgi:hypothetical protein